MKMFLLILSSIQLYDLIICACFKITQQYTALQFLYIYIELNESNEPWRTNKT